MINKQRVRRIKSGIYTFIVLMFFVPFIVMIILSVRMIGLMKLVSDRLGAIPASAAVVAEVDAGQEEQSSLPVKTDDVPVNNEAADVSAEQQQDGDVQDSEEELQSMLNQPEDSDTSEAGFVPGQAGEASLLKNTNHPDTGGKANRMML